MTTGAFGSTPFSAKVRLWLECEIDGGHVIRLAQVASDFVIAVEPEDIPECDASVVVSVDGKEHRRPVRFLGMSAENPEAAVSPRGELSESLPF